MRYLLIAVGIMLMHGSVSAQHKKNWYLLPQLGVLSGTDVTGGQLMLSGGMIYKGWDLGLGVAADYYSIHSVPLVADIRRHISKLPLFAYTNMGYNIAAPLPDQYLYESEGWNHSKSSFGNGWYGEWGLGYDLEIKKSNRMLFSLGYSIKTLSEQYSEIIPRDFPPYYNEISQHHYDYQFNRFVFKLGFRF
jgi:hypothetical protein